MMTSTAWTWTQAQLARACHAHMPVLWVHWQNHTLFASPFARAGRALALSVATSGALVLLWQSLAGWAALPSSRWAQRQLQVRVQTRQQVDQQAQAVGALAAMERLRQVALDQQAQIDEQVLAWPNSALRLSLLNQMQQMAQQRGLHVRHLRSLHEPAQHGYEGSAVHFSVLGTEWAVHAYWQALQQLLQNGAWTSWAIRLQPDGQYSFEGHLALLWDAQDAITDTGVALQWHASVAASAAAQPVAVPVHAHVLSDQSQAQMRVVGAAQSTLPGNPETAWTWIRSGTSVHLVRPGQLLGREHSKVGFTDALGLRLSAGAGQADSQLGWEVVKP